jgi:hypothetical protein
MFGREEVGADNIFDVRAAKEFVGSRVGIGIGLADLAVVIFLGTRAVIMASIEKSPPQDRRPKPCRR